MTLRVAFLAIGLALIGCEVLAVWDYGSIARWPMYLTVGGALMVLGAPLVPVMARHLWVHENRALSIVASALSIALVLTVILTGIARTGSYADAAAVLRATTDSKLRAAMEAKADAVAAVADAKSVFDTAQAGAASECVGKGQRGDRCREWEASVAKAQLGLERARADLAMKSAAAAALPHAEPDPLATRISSLTGISEQTVILAWPCVWPAILYVFGFVSIAAATAQRRSDLEPKAADPLEVVSGFAIDRLSEGGRSPVTIGTLYGSYLEWTKSNRASPLSCSEFENAFQRVCHEAGWRLNKGAVLGITFKGE